MNAGKHWVGIKKMFPIFVVVLLSLAAIEVRGAFPETGTQATVVQTNPAPNIHLLQRKANLQAQSVNSQTELPAPTAYSVIDRGGNNRVWERITYERTPDGKIVPKKHHYTEIATGMHYKNIRGQWTESKEEIDALPQGGAAATQGQQQAYFPGDIYQGVIEIMTPDGKQLQSRPMGLSYFDGTNSVLIAELTNSIGQLVSSNQIVYPNAFTDFKADLVYTYRKSGFEQDIVLREQPPTPETFGLSSQYSRLQLLTEFFDTPEPIQTSSSTSKDGLKDTTLQFGTTTMGHGKAFAVGNASPKTPVYKSWQHLDGRTFLVEELPFNKIASSLQSLPLPVNASSPVVSLNSALHKVSNSRLLVPARLVQKSSTNTVQLAKIDLNKEQGVVLDYATINSDQTDFTFQGDTTYFITGAFNISDTTTFEGGTVIKFDNSGASIGVNNVVCQTGPYRPAVLTAQDDDSVGETISGSTGTPSGFYAGNAISSSSATGIGLYYMRIEYANNAFYDVGNDFFDGTSASHVQILNCGNALYSDGEAYTGIWFGNGLISGVNCAFNGVGWNGGGTIVQSTVNNCNTLVNDDAGDGVDVNFYNCVLANVTNATVDGVSAVDGDHNGFYNASTFGSVQFATGTWPFQTVGGGSYYLTNGTPFRNVGSTNIDAGVLADIATKTTYPPIVFSNAEFFGNYTLTPQVPRDTNSAPDLGYHYDPMDYAFGNLNLSIDNLIFTPGTVVGWFSGNGIILNSTAGVIMQGTATKPCWFVCYDTVQEVSNTNWDSAGAIGFETTDWGLGVAAWFSKWSQLAGNVEFFNDDNGGYFYAANSEFYGGINGDYIYTGYILFNDLFFRVNFDTDDDSDDFAYIQNCTFFNGSFKLSRDDGGPTWKVLDTAFDGTSINISDDGLGGDPDYTTFDYNAYLTNADRLSPEGGDDVILIDSFNWQTSWLGDFYQSTNSLLIDAGNTTADQLGPYYNITSGLYHFTTQTNQVKETNSVVDIGYHYVATDQYGNPLDTNGDGIPDYLEDVNGNGVVNGGETNWALAILVQPTNLFVNRGNNAIFSVTAAGIAPLHYQWYSNSVAFGSATNATLLLNNVQTNNAGNYYVIVTNNFGSISSSVATLAVVVPPTVVITNPGNNTVFIATSTNISLTAIASDIEGIISQVQFFEGTNSLGIVTNSPYVLVWSNTTTGNYALTAVAVDNGLAATSPIVNITISPLFATNTMRLWLKADAIAGLTNNNTPINTWSDNSGWGNDAIQSNTNNQPRYVTNSINGFPVVRFDGTNDVFNLPFFMNQATGGEAFVVLKVAATHPSSSRGLWYMGGSGIYDNEMYPDTDGKIYEDFGRAGNATSPLGNSPSPIDQCHVYEVTSQTNDWRAWINGQLLYQTTVNSVWFSGGATLGADSFHFGGDMAEVLVFNRGLTDGERITINQYLNSKYGMVPTVSITAPTNNAVFATGSNIGLSATASQPNGGTIKQVEYFQGSASLGVSTTSPYNIIWNNVKAGASTNTIFALTARVTGYDGLMSTSSVVTISVDPPPIVSIIAPTNNADLGIAPLNIPVGATASDINGISRVQFFQGTNSLGIATNTPYGLLWTNVAAGTYQLTAVATGSDGISTTSSVISVLVDTDTDEDGLGDYQEYLYGTNPNMSDGFWIWVGNPSSINGIP